MTHFLTNVLGGYFLDLFLLFEKYLLVVYIMLTQKEKNRQLGTKLTRSFIHQHSHSGNGPVYRLILKSGDAMQRWNNR